jgi:TonB family protein
MHAMAMAAPPLPPEAVARSNRALAVGLAVSLAAHLAVAASLRPVSGGIAPPNVLHVVIRDAEAGRRAPPADGANSDVAAGPARTATPAEAPASSALARAPGAVPEAQGLGLALERYYTSREVDVRAEPLNQPALVYPQEAYQARTRGKVTLRILISERGGVDGIAVLEAEPRGVFEAAALAAAQALEFSPASIAGRTVKSQKTVEVAFDPYESIAIP